MIFIIVVVLVLSSAERLVDQIQHDLGERSGGEDLGVRVVQMLVRLLFSVVDFLLQ